MPDASSTTGPVGSHPRSSSEVLLTALADAVLAVAGVVRLEPTLSTSGPRVLVGRHHTDGLHVLQRSGEADVDVNVATSSTHQARTVAHQIHTSIAEVLAAHGHSTGSITVSVLRINPAAPDPAP